LAQIRDITSAKSEHPRLTNCEIILEVFQPTIPQRHGRMDRWLDVPIRVVVITEGYRKLPKATEGYRKPAWKF